MKITHFFLILTLFLTACKVPELVLHQDLKSNATSYPVKGKQGFMINQHMKFGNYYTSKIHRGWTNSYDIPFFVRFQGSSEKLNFTQFGESDLNAEVFCIGKLKSVEYEVCKNYFGVPIKYENTFSGTIYTNKKDNWDFIVYNPDSGYGNGQFSTTGFARNHSGSKIEIRPVSKLVGVANWLNIENYGFEFYENESPVAAVSTINNGKVWLKNDLDKNKKLIISSLASALMLKSTLGTDFKSQY